MNEQVVPTPKPGTPSPAAVSAPVGNSEKKGIRVLVKATDSPVSLLSLDQQGAELLFDGREDFVTMTEAEERQLSRDNRQRYSMARTQHEVWMKNESTDLADEFESLQYAGRASDKLNLVASDPNFVYRWTLPIKVTERQSIGWTLCDASGVRSFLGPTKNHHEIGNKGQTELVLMKMPVALWNKRQAAKAEKNKQAATSATQQFDQAARSAGLAVVDDNPKDGKSWKELEAT